MPKLITTKTGEKTDSGKAKKVLEYSPAEIEELKRLGKGIAKLIISSGVSIDKFAIENDLGTGHISRIIRGKADIKYCTLRTIAKGLGFKDVASFLAKAY